MGPTEKRVLVVEGSDVYVATVAVPYLLWLQWPSFVAVLSVVVLTLMVKAIATVGITLLPFSVPSLYSGSYGGSAACGA